MAYPQLTAEPTARECVGLVRSGAAKPSELAEAAIARIEMLDGHTNAVVVRDFERARTAAAELDARTPGEDLPLLGVAMTVKESFNVAGLPTTYGHERFRGHIAERDSEVVRRLKAAGAVILGKTNVPPDLADFQSDNPVYGRTVNPHDPARTAGGSSGGSAVAVASGMVPCEYGSDIGSSIRNPAHFNGIYGHKTSYGLVSRRGHSHPALGNREVADGPLSVVGPLARTADDLALLLGVTADFALTPRARPLAEMRFLALLEHPVSTVDAAVREPIEAALGALEGAGARVERTSPRIPDLAGQHADYLRLLNTVMSGGVPPPGRDPVTLLEWFKMLSAQARAEYAWAELFADYDFVLAPPLPFVAFPHDATPLRDRRIAIDGEDHAFADALAWAGIATYPNLPSTVVPVGASGHLPCGLQVIGRRWSDFDCIATAGAIGALLHA